MRLLRQIVCDERVVRRYFDLHGNDSGVGGGSGQRPHSVQEPDRSNESETLSKSDTLHEFARAEDVPGPSTEPEWSDPLLDELDRGRDGAMHDIVETIQRDQLRLVTERPGGVLIVQGGPGTGKTAVGLHRVSWLLDNRHMAADDVLVLGPSRDFLEYAASASWNWAATA